MSLTPRVIPGATYGEAWPGGLLVTTQTVPPGLDTDLMFTRAAADGRSGGKDHEGPHGGHALYWRGDKWCDLAPDCSGSNPVAFHPTSGEVYVSIVDGVDVFNRAGDRVRRIPGFIGVNGIRWINHDGTVVSGDSTYGIKNLIGQYTDIGDGILIGQGIAGGLDCVVNGVRKHLCDGVVEFHHANRVGDAVTVYWKDNGKGADAHGYVLDTSISELGDYPPAERPAPPVVLPPAQLPGPTAPPPLVSAPTLPRTPPPSPEQPPTPTPALETSAPKDTPKGPTVIHVDVSSPLLNAVSGDVVDNGNGTISVKKTNGKILCVTPTGGIEERDDPGGPWESFTRSGGFLVAMREWDDKPATFLLPFVETA